MAEIFYGFELLLFKKFSASPEDWIDLKNRLLEKVGEDGVEIPSPEDLGANIPQSMWFLSVALHRRPAYLLQLVKEIVEREKQKRLRKPGETLLQIYLNSHNFTEVHLDSIFKYRDDNKLPREEMQMPCLLDIDLIILDITLIKIFDCPSIKFLSLKYNCLDNLPADIGRMKNLEYLALTNNKLQVQSLPYTLTFCKKLRTILLDNNLLDALPGFLLKMSSIKTVHRHGNHNYFKSTFMWYHTDVDYRIIPVSTNSSSQLKNPHSLQFWAAKTLIGLKLDFFSDPGVATVLKGYLSDIYSNFHICHYCNTACLHHEPGYKVITFKNPYLGNSCVPFQHWACSIECAKALEVPARMEQIAAAKRLDELYEEYVCECQKMFHSVTGRSSLCTCVSINATDETADHPEDSRSGCAIS